MNTPSRCAVSGCAKPARMGYSRYCHQHAETLRLYAHPTARALTAKEATLHRKFIQEVFARRRSSAVMRAGMEIARELLDYTPRLPLSRYDRGVAELMASLRERETTPWEILLVTCEVLALEYREPAQIVDTKVATYALARRVTLIRTWRKGWRPTGRLLKHLGELLRESLGAFALRMIEDGERWQAMLDERRERLGGEW
jgi:hypothetical protein